MYSKKDLKNFLEEISPSAKFIRFDYVSQEKFRIELRCHAEKDQPMEFYVQLAKKWIKQFSIFTATSWIVLNSFLKLKRLVFRKNYTCQRSAHNKKKTKTEYESRNQGCKAKIDFKIKLTNRNTIRNDKFLKEGLNLSIKIDFVHSHKVRAPESYQLLRNTPETEEIFQKYFEMGCTLPALKSYHELTLTDKYGENCPEVFENAVMNPRLRNVFYLHQKMKKNKIIREMSVFEHVQEKMASWKESDLDIILSEIDMETFVIITPFMKRVITEFDLKYVLVDSTDISNGPTTTFILVPTTIGALPIACALHNRHDLNSALDLAKSQLEKLAGHELYPKILMIDSFENNKILPAMKTLESRHALCCRTWRWLNEDENKIERKKRHNIMSSIHSFVYAKSLEAAEKIYLELQACYSETNSKLKEYLKNIWGTKEQWMFFEDHILSNNLVDMSIRFLNEFINERCKSFNVVVMLEVITNILENNFKRILASYVNKKSPIATYTKFLTKAKIVLGFGSDVRRISANVFKIDVQTKPKRYITFKTDTMCCDCYQGRKGNLCEHLCAIINIVDCEVMKSSILTDDQKEKYTKITGGDVKEDIKPEISDDTEHFKSDGENGEFDDEETSLALDTVLQSGESSPKAEDCDGNYDDFYVEVKTERQDKYDDPLDEPVDQEEQYQNDLAETVTQNTTDQIPTTSKHSDKKKTYETALKAVNDEFRRLNRYFSENPNASNLETMTRLARELNKIRPVEQVNLDNMFLKLNANRKRKSES